MAKDLTRRGVFLGKWFFKDYNSEVIQVAHAYDMFDEDSPDGIYFAYDIFDILPDGNIAFCDGGCYWGYESETELLNDFCSLEDMVEVFDEEVNDMLYKIKFDYQKLNELASKT